MKAMLLAAGRGERLRPLTDHCPKPLIDVAGRPLIEHALDRLQSAGVSHCVINLNWLADKIQSHLQRAWRWDMQVSFSHEPGERLETGGGIFKVLDQLGDAPFLVVNADVYCDADLSHLVTRAQNWALGHAAHLLLVDNPEHNPGGDFSLGEGDLLQSEGPRLTFAGISLMQAALFAGQSPGRFALAPLLRQAIQSGRVSGEHYHGPWTDVGTPERLETLRRSLV